ncbi:MAG: hypothetical protein OXC60_13100 [Litoreibacter sp.]|nr:hypothetical protein [Litoreibacter sp.]MCY4335590.1 hypothetical protein [Litoreibacter sp.]
MSGIGHNNGPTMEAGYSWRKHSWSKARAELLPTLPIEVLRTRVKRAKALGLPYKTYASVRASTGRDVVGFLFSNNALRVQIEGQRVPEARVKKLTDAAAKLAALVHAPLAPEAFRDLMAQDGLTIEAARAPHFSQSWSDSARAVLAPVQAAKLPRDGVLVIGDTALEAEWSEIAKLAGFLPSERYFTALDR